MQNRQHGNAIHRAVQLTPAFGAHGLHGRIERCGSQYRQQHKAANPHRNEGALGNVIGSNMFNLLAIIGIAALVAPIPVADEFLRFDLWVMLAASFLLIPFVFFGQNITRIWGAALTLLYMAYLLVVLL